MSLLTFVIILILIAIAVITVIFALASLTITIGSISENSSSRREKQVDRISGRIESRYSKEFPLIDDHGYKDVTVYVSSKGLYYHVLMISPSYYSDSIEANSEKAAVEIFLRNHNQLSLSNKIRVSYFNYPVQSAVHDLRVSTVFRTLFVLASIGLIAYAFIEKQYQSLFGVLVTIPLARFFKSRVIAVSSQYSASKEDINNLRKKTHITGNSIKIEGKRVIYVDPFHIDGEPKDADIVLITHPYGKYYSPEDIQKILKNDTEIVVPKGAKKTVKQALRKASVNGHLSDGYYSFKYRGIQVIGTKCFDSPEGIGYIITVDNVRVYLNGHSDFGDELKAGRADIIL